MRNDVMAYLFLAAVTSDGIHPKCYLGLESDGVFIRTVALTPLRHAFLC